MATEDSSWTVKQCIQVFREFLIVCIHCILCNRHLYPESLFIKSRKYNTVVWQSRHPILCNYIKDAVEACTQELQEGAVECIYLSIVSKDQVELERYIFSAYSIPRIPDFLLEKPVSPRMPYSDSFVESLRAAMIRIQNTTRSLRNLPEDCSWSIRLTLKENDTRPRAWENWYLSENTPESNLERRYRNLTIPLRNISIGPMDSEIWLESHPDA
ncbi:DNA polymerase zeta Rev7 [Schizosaccharomyces octosporus yFS286]|uniref:DNA polymerase zeta Rev7 n=1 Tax=Schizosaccharomyces octosporus (strain yFS286) TaxID=483514 RepID=S9Q411_SCHOY|nr:DNA polymerase zeta Rev7 [Schizosaccharomyces octosporus yFS286]EPX74398.1 DNA polymerase zeta Rev7 [Schizosaccharomyces octosporus yFS286]